MGMGGQQPRFGATPADDGTFAGFTFTDDSLQVMQVRALGLGALGLAGSVDGKDGHTLLFRRYAEYTTQPLNPPTQQAGMQALRGGGSTPSDHHQHHHHHFHH